MSASIDARLFASQRWDFELNESYNWWQNLTNEILPGLIAGDGTPFDIELEMNEHYDLSTTQSR